MPGLVVPPSKQRRPREEPIEELSELSELSEMEDSKQPTPLDSETLVSILNSPSNLLLLSSSKSNNKKKKSNPTLSSKEILTTLHSTIQYLHDQGTSWDSKEYTPLKQLTIIDNDNNEKKDGGELLLGLEMLWEMVQLRNEGVLNGLEWEEAVEDSEEEENEDEEEEMDKEEMNELDQQDFEDLEQGSDEEMDELEFAEPEEEEEEESEEPEEDNLDDLNDEDLGDSTPITSKKRSRSVLDDGFFNLDEFNKFTLDMEAKDIKRAKKQNDSEEDSADDEDDDGLAYDLSKDPDLLEDEGDVDDVDDIRYEDFFDPPETLDNNNNNDKREKKPSRRDNEDVFGDLEEEEDEEDQEEDEEMEESNSKGPRLMDLLNVDQDQQETSDAQPLSTFEKRQQKIAQQISELESEVIADKHWALGGEVNSRSRPKNSLLEETLDVDVALKPAPVITEEQTLTLEDVIKKRIVDKLFDDVERKVDLDSLKQKPFNPNKQDGAPDSKSSKSLAELYEEDYKKTTDTDATFKTDKEEALEKQHVEIEGLFKSLCTQLDALSNYFFTPKPAKPSLDITVDVPAIQIEEVMPSHVSSAQTLAPQEIFAPNTKPLKASEELTKEEKKRAHAAKKNSKSKARKQRDQTKKLIEKANPGMGNKHAKEKAMKELLGQSNVTIISNNKDFADKVNKTSKKKGGMGAKVIRHGTDMQLAKKKEGTGSSGSHLKL